MQSQQKNRNIVGEGTVVWGHFSTMEYGRIVDFPSRGSIHSNLHN
jgi:hypothetical protein